MTDTAEANIKRRSLLSYLPIFRESKVPLSMKLIFGYLLVIVFISIVFMIVGVRSINSLVLSEAQEKVRHDLNAAREIYLGQQTHIYDVVNLSAKRFCLRDALVVSNREQVTDVLQSVQSEAGIDFLVATDPYGYVVARSGNPDVVGDNQGHDEIVQAALSNEQTFAATILVSGEDLAKEDPVLAEKAHLKFIDTPLAREREEIEETAGMVIKAAAPIYDSNDKFIGVLYGGTLLNRNYEIVDKIKQTVYENVKYKNQDIGTATIFQDDLRISTNVRNEDGSRAIGTRVSEEVYNQVIIQGEPWIDRAYVVNSWYITAYEPIRDLYGRIIGILYVGVLEQKYLDIQSRATLTFLGISVIGSLISMGLSYFFARGILGPINQLVSASKEVAAGNLDTKVDIKTNDELQTLAESFNVMALALQRRDDQLKEFATQKVMESERLALVGQLSANIAHELNNPLQGIVTFSHLLIEENSCQDPNTRYSLEKIAGQANRCRDIIRGLLDFSRQRRPDKTHCNVNHVLDECISLVEHQALFHNIRVVKHFQDDIALAIIDSAQIERVFINLIINAAEAMDGSGYLDIATRYNAEEEYVEIAISDTGEGISEDNMKKIFDPFFTTKEVGHGTGLGLAISYGIVKGHKGTISVDSTVGEGTTFVVKLPIEGNGSNGDTHHE